MQPIGKLFWSADPNKPVDIWTGNPRKMRIADESISLKDHNETLVSFIYRSLSSNGYIVTSYEVISLLEQSYRYRPYLKEHLDVEMIFGPSENIGCLDYYPIIDIYVCPENPPPIIYLFDESEWQHSAEIKVVNI